MYNFTNITAGNTTLDIMKAVNLDLTNGFFALFLMIALFTIVFINMSFYRSSHAWLVASFVTSTIAGLFWLAGFVQFIVWIVSILFVVAGGLMALLSKS